MPTFPAALALHALRVGPWRRNEAGETTFMILSLAAKTLLAWQIVGGTLREVAIA